MYQSKEHHSLDVGVLDVVVVAVGAERKHAEIHETCPDAYHAVVDAAQAQIEGTDIAFLRKGPRTVDRKQYRGHARTQPGNPVLAHAVEVMQPS
jgi:hypothetical protein